MDDETECCPCCGAEWPNPDPYGHRALLAWIEERTRAGDTVKLALFTSDPPQSIPDRAS